MDPIDGKRTQAHQFWVGHCHKTPEARALASQLGLELPNGSPYGLTGGLKYPLRRLVVTGQDTPENFRILFGNDHRGVADMHSETRKEVLMQAAVQTGSPADRLNGWFDKGAPYFSPRPASDAEQQEIKQSLDFADSFSQFLSEQK